VNVEIVPDDALPSHAVYVTTTRHRVRLTVSPRVEATALAVLQTGVRVAVADALDGSEDGVDGK
jgi:hypothetical protein